MARLLSRFATWRASVTQLLGGGVDRVLSSNLTAESWFATKRGRTFTYCCVGAAALTAFGTSALQGPFIDKLKEIIQVYQNGEPKPLPPNVNRIIEEVLHDSNLEEEKKQKLQFFYVHGHEPFYAGGLSSPWGAIIGIPFFFEEMKNFSISEIQLPGKGPIDWVIDGRDLLDALLISDSAKKFALMQAICSCNYTDTLINSCLGAGCILFSARIAQRLNATFDALKRTSFKQRCLRYSLLYMLGYILYRLLKDPTKHLSDQKADKLAAETGPEYLDGGIEYYKQTLLKNKALEALSSSRIRRRVYDEKGDESYFLLVPKLPTSKRLDNLQKMKKEIASEVKEKHSK